MAIDQYKLLSSVGLILALSNRYAKRCGLLFLLLGAPFSSGIARSMVLFSSKLFRFCISCGEPTD